ncbi:hypothetical protein [Marinobacter salarius]|uniref:Uncharacterized protein n=1 Tax=Marinobacter salarius TaxID=1420917 RepID=A0A1W6KGA7_9GAMM|nr:hypothetical protein [Marinobacter salarius]ARM86359.1 hypothetical protein MARSALSMR5_04342 [Marinobacter salarius]
MIVKKFKNNPAFYLALTGALLSMLIWLAAVFEFIPGSYVWTGLLGLLVCGPIALAKDPTEAREGKSVDE